MKVLKINIQEKEAFLDNVWLEGYPTHQEKNLIEASGGFFKVLFKDHSYYLLFEGKQVLVKDSMSIFLKKYKINFTAEEETYAPPSGPSPNALLRDDFSSPQPSFSHFPDNKSDSDGRLNFLYAGLLPSTAEDFRISSSLSLSSNSFNKNESVKKDQHIKKIFQYQNTNNIKEFNNTYKRKTIHTKNKNKIINKIINLFKKEQEK